MPRKTRLSLFSMDYQVFAMVIAVLSCDPERTTVQHLNEESMQPQQDFDQGAADLYWLAFLITGDTETSIDITAEALAFQNSQGCFFSDQTSSGTRRLVMAEALA